MQSKLNRHSRPHCPEVTRDRVDQITAPSGYRTASELLAMMFGDRLEIETIDCQVSVLFEIRLDHGIVDLLTMLRFREIKIGDPPAPVETSMDFDASIMSVGQDLSHVHRHHIIPHGQGVEFQPHHLIKVTAVVVNNISPRPQTTFGNGRRGDHRLIKHAINPGPPCPRQIQGDPTLG